MDGGDLKREIAPFEDVEEDEQPRRSRIDRIPTLRPAFAQGRHHHGGERQFDLRRRVGAGARRRIRRRRCEPLARVVGHATHSIHPSPTSLSRPSAPSTSCWPRSAGDKDDVDLFEINEAFAMVTMLAISELGLDPDKVNLYGGACAQGHPIGSTGSRLLVTLAHALGATGGTKGVASLCIGGGEATAMAIERV